HRGTIACNGKQPGRIPRTCPGINQEKCRAGRRAPGTGISGCEGEWSRKVSADHVEPGHSSSWPESLQWLLGIVIIAVFIVTFIVQAFQIPSESMENTLLIGDYLLVDKFRYGGGSFWDNLVPYRPVHRGDIIVFRYPVNPAQHFVKRVVGVPGDHVRLINREVFVN